MPMESVIREWVSKWKSNTLGLTNTTVAISRLDDDEVTKFNLGSLSGETNFISEAGRLSRQLAKTEQR